MLVQVIQMAGKVHSTQEAVDHIDDDITTLESIALDNTEVDGKLISDKLVAMIESILSNGGYALWNNDLF